MGEGRKVEECNAPTINPASLVPKLHAPGRTADPAPYTESIPVGSQAGVFTVRAPPCCALHARYRTVLARKGEPPQPAFLHKEETKDRVPFNGTLQQSFFLLHVPAQAMPDTREILTTSECGKSG